MQCRPRRCHTHGLYHIGKALGEEVEIFENAEKTEVHDHAKGQNGFAWQSPWTGKKGQPPKQPCYPTTLFPFFSYGNRIIEVWKPESKPAIHDGRKHDEGKKTPVPTSIKKVTRQEANPYPPTPLRSEIERKKEGYKKEEAEGVENQIMWYWGEGWMTPW